MGILGFKYSEESKKKMSDSQKGNKNALGNQNWLGRKHSEKTNRKMSQVQKGKPKSLKSRKKMSESRKKLGLIGEKSKVWKGDKVSYSGLHKWVNQYRGRPSFCEDCKTTMPPKGKGLKRSYFQWANVSGKYLRDLKDWIRLCVPCHKRFDKEHHSTKFGRPKKLKIMK